MSADLGSVKVQVTWDADFVEVRLIEALGDLLKRAREEGLTNGGYQRVARYFVAAADEFAPLTPTPIKESKP